jgi:hypothetical protein
VWDINVDKVVYISHTVTDSGYNAVTMSDVLVHVSDIPVEFVQVCNFWFFVCFGWQLEEVKPQSIIQSATSATITEATTGTYTIVLDSEPTSDVTIGLTSSDITAATVTPSLTFTTSNWSRPQTITVTAVNDPDMDNETVTIRHVVSGGGYGSVGMSDIEVRIIDRTPNPALKSITQSTTTVDIDENTTDTYTVVLDADPIGDVVIAMTSSDTNIVTVTPSLTFTTNNWATQNQKLQT